MEYSFSIPVKRILLMLVLLSISLACNLASATSGIEATSQALQATQLALDTQVAANGAQQTPASSLSQSAQATNDFALRATTNALNAQATTAAYQSSQQSQPQQSAGDNTSLISFMIYNQSAYSICRVYFSPPTSSQWLLEDSFATNIPSGYQQEFSMPSGDYDLLAKNCADETLEYYYNVNIPYYTSWTVTGGANTSGSEPLCGDGYCGNYENSGNCPQDCGEYDEPLCGDGYCGNYENSGNCPQDCGGYDGPLCGDGYCGNYENSGNCPQDCGGYDGPLCGDGYCGNYENAGNCPQDCP